MENKNYEDMNFGIKNEYEIVDEINEKTFSQLSDNWKKAIKLMCARVEDDDVITARKLNFNCKPDIEVTLHNRHYYISIKIGYSVSPHREYMDNFYNYLVELGVEGKYFRTLRLYHFGDGTTSGRGTYHLSVDEVKEKYRDEIKEFNEYINQDKFLIPIFERLFKYGSGKFDVHANFLYLGGPKEGQLVRMCDLINYLTNTKSLYLDSIHFGPLIYAPGYRGLKDFDPTKKDRYYVVIKWTTVIDDVSYINGTITDYKRKFLEAEENLKNNSNNTFKSKFKQLIKKITTIFKPNNKK